MTIDGMIATLKTIDPELRRQEIRLIKQESPARVFDLIDTDLIFEIVLKNDDIISIH